MACLEMFNTDQLAPMSPRISFSNDFVDTQQAIKQHEQHRNSRSDQSSLDFSSNFEFSVSNFNMMSADELFAKGKLLPFKQSDHEKTKVTTLRNELLNDDDDGENDSIFSLKPPKGPVRWKEFLGLNKRTHVLSSKKVHDHNKVHDGSKMERVVEGNESMLIQEEEAQIRGSFKY